MRFRIHVLLLVLHLAMLLPVRPAGPARIRKKATRRRSCLDLPEELLEQMFGRLSVGVMSAFHHALQLEPQNQLNISCPDAGWVQTDSKTRLPVNLLSISPWAYRVSYDPGRYPRYIPEAYCLCKGCLLGAEGERYHSTPVYAPSVILKRTGSCVGGRYSYSEIYVSVAVGCTCVSQDEKHGDGLSSLEGGEPKARPIHSAGGKARRRLRDVDLSHSVV
uniref:Interleukin 17d n=2 Tax=Nothobranchius kuhntae TaxID=321403 RepID=A0A1A8JI37_NOTKU